VVAVVIEVTGSVTHQTGKTEMSNIQVLFLGQIEYSSSLFFSREVFADETRIG
jgi:hypothetical protein